MPSLSNARRQLTRRRFLAGGAVTVAAMSLYSGELERHALTTVRRTIQIANLPTAFHGFRIAQISDIHFRAYDEPYFVQHAVNTVNRLKPDMVAITGDFITAHRTLTDNIRTNVKDANECAEILKGLQAPLRFCSLGNHDVEAQDQILPVLAANGLTPLRNVHQAIDLRGDRLWVAGIADAYFDVPNLAMALPPRKVGEPVVLLGHEPDFVDRLVEAGGADLMLAGHTHGGQVRIPLAPALFLPAMGVKYVEGLFHFGNTQLYVNRGLGCMHLPFRFNCPPEVTVMTLQPAP
jgi:predicted MPP superfamily phosphohydrolase